MTLVCILVLGLSGCGDTLTLNQYNTSEIWYIAYTDIDTVCESNELTADGSSILHSEEDYLLLSYVVDSNIEITKELKDGGWDHLILTNPQWIDRFGDPSKLKPVEYGSLANSMQEFLDVQMPILTADGNVLPDGVGLYQYDGETLLAFPRILGKAVLRTHPPQTFGSFLFFVGYHVLMLKCRLHVLAHLYRHAVLTRF